jgi:hypothetical protein
MEKSRYSGCGEFTLWNFHHWEGRFAMWISSVWYSFRLIGATLLLKSVLMRKTIVINLLLILGYYLILQLLIWIAMVLR